MVLLTAKQACEMLGVRAATLYAYVSRGMLRSVEDANGRSRRYPQVDVEALKARRQLRRRPEQAVQDALHWGTPMMASSVSSIARGRLLYRGEDAVAMAQEGPFERIVAWLWEGEFSPEVLRPRSWNRMLARTAAWPPPLRFRYLLSAAAAEDLGAWDLRPAIVRRSGGRILRLLAATGAAPRQPSIAGQLFGRARRAVDLALGLLADHELNVSTFTARCVASSGATPYAAVTAGMAALEGVRHGGQTERVQALFRDRRDPAAVLESFMRTGERPPGFGHPLYPEGDPRAAALLALLPEKETAAWIKAGERVLEEKPNVDFALVAMARHYRLPEHAPITLFAVARTAGWIAHVLEQLADGRLIRPRAGGTPGA